MPNETDKDKQIQALQKKLDVTKIHMIQMDKRVQLLMKQVTGMDYKIKLLNSTVSAMQKMTRGGG